ncbi:ABC1 kinase family protein [Ectothiorhodospira variabilis]|uniref:ABC1 kinase family protein n=1 Tax=Ectothiorhodospira variabilis TaxID=505694 RepID=UPI001EFB9D8C|nr:AarF/UbiB family protein [Ectothiorhodospira variabilis]MCG5497929.1 AarF/UbiB family protein [Ectothiorhodospira variabilis]
MHDQPFVLGTLDALRLWQEMLHGTQRGAQHAGNRATLEYLALWNETNSPFDGLLPLRCMDLNRSHWTLWSTAALGAMDHAGRQVAPWIRPPLVSVPTPPWGPLARSAILGLMAQELWMGYAVLRERGRWAPWLATSRDWELQHERGAHRVLAAAQSLGGSLIKAAQFASSRPDLLPLTYTKILSQLQDRVTPQPWPVIEQALIQELGQPIHRVFAEVDPQPVAAASIAQVHHARLHDGRRVALKVQYPDMQNLIEADLAAMEHILNGISRLEPELRLEPVLDYLRQTLPMEVDFLREARSGKQLGQLLASRRVVIPEVLESLSTSRLLVSDWVEGIKINDVQGLRRAGLDPRAVAEQLMDVYAEQLFQHGYFHADPHPGNLWVRPGPDGPVLVLLDHGLTGPLPEGLRRALKQAVGALMRGDFSALSRALAAAGLDLDPVQDADALLWLVDLLLGSHGLGEAGQPLTAGKDPAQLGRRLGSRIEGLPVELMRVGRGVGLLDGVLRQLAPGMNLLERMEPWLEA